MNDLLPILTGLIVISALAVVASNDKDTDKDKDKDKDKDRDKDKNKKEVRERKEKKDEDTDIKKLFGYFKNKLSAKKKPKRYRKQYVNGKTARLANGDTAYVLKSNSK